MYEHLIDEIATKMRRQKLQPACSDACIERLKARSFRELNYEIHSEYASFLSITNGLVWNGLCIFASETSPLEGFPNSVVDGFVEGNLEYRSLRPHDPMEDYVIFGLDSVVFFTYHNFVQTFEVISIVGMSVCESFSTFDELMVNALQGHV